MVKHLTISQISAYISFYFHFSINHLNTYVYKTNDYILPPKNDNDVYRCEAKDRHKNVAGLS